MATAMQTRSVAAAYDRWAPVYDLVFGAVFRQGRSIAIDAANRVAMSFLDRHASYGRSRGSRVASEGLVVASFLHGTSRALEDTSY